MNKIIGWLTTAMSAFVSIILKDIIDKNQINKQITNEFAFALEKGFNKFKDIFYNFWLIVKLLSKTIWMTIESHIDNQLICLNQMIANSLQKLLENELNGDLMQNKQLFQWK